MGELWVRGSGKRFLDQKGRQLILRGLNLGGDSKLPYPDGGTHLPTDFSDHRSVSFIGRPLPLATADEHLRRIASWGFNCLRLVVTWEAVEHSGPLQYDQGYLEYIEELCKRAEVHNLAVFIDFHQDAWSRMSGGSGAPGWVFEKIGLDFTRFDRANAAHVMQYRYDYSSAMDRQEDRYPSMSWAINYQMPVNGILWSTFFAGSRLTPKWLVNGRNVQDYLQSHYLGAMRCLAERLVGMDNVIGFDTLNEPGLGWLGQKLQLRDTNKPNPRRAGLVWTPLDGLKVAAGIPTSIPFWQTNEDHNKITGLEQRTVNPDGISIWSQPGPDPFEQAGAWRRQADGGVSVDEEFFCRSPEDSLDAERDYMLPFFHRVADTIRAIRSEWMLFAEINPYATSVGRKLPSGMPENSVNACHWYDVNLLWSKRFGVGNADRRETLRQRYRQQLGHMQGLGDHVDGGMPSIIGEFGIPYDLADGTSFDRWSKGERQANVWDEQTEALGLIYEVFDDLLLSGTQWNYTASNRNSLRIGDGWNQEDLSIYSEDQATESKDPYSGARAAEGFCRVYVRAAQGLIASMRYCRYSRRFSLDLQADSQIELPTDIYIPPHLGAPKAVSLEGAAAEYIYDEQRGRLLVQAKASGNLKIELNWASI